MVLGFRVVRGSVGTQSENETEQHVVGTITEIKGDNSVMVVWDTGQVTETEVGDGGKCDLRVFDSGPSGIRHRYIHCEGCDVKHITGTRWRCGVCDDVSLCTPCYHDDSHDTTHPFLRMDFPCEASVKVEKRLASKRGRISGLYPEAEITRGVHWEYGDQDGGKGTVGKVVDIADHDEASSRSMVTVTWSSSGESRDYRAGYQGKVDLCCRQAAPGADYYYEHLSCVDVAQYRKWHEKADVLKVNDKVYVERLAEARAWLKGKGAWREDMEELASEVGVIKAISADGTAEMQLERISVTLDTSFLEKLPCHTVGDVVRVIDQKDMLQRFQKKHGGWDECMDKAMGKLGVVKVIDTDGDVAVKVGDASFVFHPACLIPSPTEMIPRHQPKSHAGETTRGSQPHSTTPPQSGIHRPEADNSTPEFLQSFGGLAFLQFLAMGQAMGQAMGNTLHEQEFVKAVLENNCTAVTRLLQQHPELKDLSLQGIPALSLAAHQGHTAVINILLEAGAGIDVCDDKQNTPLNISLVQQKGDAARILIQRGANVKHRNCMKQTALHMAANFNMFGVVKLLLEKGCDINVQDCVMHTALHWAILNKHNESAAMLIEHPDVDVRLKNDRQMNALAFACFSGHTLSVDKLIAKDPPLVNLAKTPDGWFPLHITAANNHHAEARLLLEKGKAEVNVRNANDLTPLHVATSEGYYTMTELLLNHGANARLKDQQGNTPLHACMMEQRKALMALIGIRDPGEDEERTRIAIILLQHNASVDAVNNMGVSPMQGCCVQRIKDAVAAYIRSSPKNERTELNTESTHL